MVLFLPPPLSLSHSLTLSLLDASFPLRGLEIRLRRFFYEAILFRFPLPLRSSFSKLTFYGNLIYFFSLPPEKQFWAKSHYRGVFVKCPVNFFLEWLKTDARHLRLQMRLSGEGRFSSQTNSLTAPPSCEKHRNPASYKQRVPQWCNRSWILIFTE